MTNERNYDGYMAVGNNGGINLPTSFYILGKNFNPEFKAYGIVTGAH